MKGCAAELFDWWKPEVLPGKQKSPNPKKGKRCHGNNHTVEFSDDINI